MFLPATKDETRALGWDRLDVILVTGDAYIDSPHVGVAVVGKMLVDAGFKVGIIAQPDVSSGADISRLGEPALYWGVTAGCLDSMVANYTALNKPRRSDDFTPGGRNDRRPDRAVIAYANLIRRHFKQTRPIVLGGVEASLRRISHFDFKTNSVRRSVLADAKADVLVYGMGEAAAVELARRMAASEPVFGIRGTCTLEKDAPDAYVALPSHDDVRRDPAAFMEMFRLFQENNDPFIGKGMVQQQDTRFLVHHPPRPPLTEAEMDRVHALDFERDVHPLHKAEGEVRALETIRFSIPTHWGCFGGCRFCAISVHQGRRVVSRSGESIVEEARRIARHPAFKGTIPDAGGPTANMYKMACTRTTGVCRRPDCLAPKPCRNLDLSHKPQIDLLRKLRAVPGVKNVFIGSGVRHDLVLADAKHGEAYLSEIVRHHVSGQLKVAPEHAAPEVLRLMGKPDVGPLIEFKARFEKMCRRHSLRRYLTCYFIAAHPGCTMDHMMEARRFADRELKFRPEQVQIFTPTPSTLSTAMYHAGRDPDTGAKIFVEKGAKQKQRQKDALAPTPTRKKGKGRKGSL